MNPKTKPTPAIPCPPLQHCTNSTAGLSQQDFCQQYVLARAGCLLSNMNGAYEADHALAAWKRIVEGAK